MIENHIRELVGQSLPRLRADLRTWTEAHLVEPREVVMWDNETRAQISVWIVTDHTGQNDSTYRIVFEANAGCFGLAMTSEDGTDWYMGAYTGDFVDIFNTM